MSLITNVTVPGSLLFKNTAKGKQPFVLGGPTTEFLALEGNNVGDDQGVGPLVNEDYTREMHGGVAQPIHQVHTPIAQTATFELDTGGVEVPVEIYMVGAGGTARDATDVGPGGEVVHQTIMLGSGTYSVTIGPRFWIGQIAGGYEKWIGPDTVLSGGTLAAPIVARGGNWNDPERRPGGFMPASMRDALRSALTSDPNVNNNKWIHKLGLFKNGVSGGYPPHANPGEPYALMRAQQAGFGAGNMQLVNPMPADPNLWPAPNDGAGGFWGQQPNFDPVTGIIDWEHTGPWTHPNWHSIGAPHQNRWYTAGPGAFIMRIVESVTPPAKFPHSAVRVVAAYENNYKVLDPNVTPGAGTTFDWKYTDNQVNYYSIRATGAGPVSLLVNATTPLPVEAGKWYRANVWARPAAAATGEVTVTWTGADGTHVSSPVTFAANDFLRIASEFEAPAGATGMSLAFEVTAADVEFDDVFIEEILVAAPFTHVNVGGAFKELVRPATIPAVVRTNLAPDPSIEAGVGGWPSPAPSVLEQSTEHALVGTHSLKYTKNHADGTATASRHSMIPVKPNTRYTMSASVFGAPGLQASVGIEYRDASGTNVPGGPSGTNERVTTDGATWQRIVVHSWSTPANVTQVQIRVAHPATNPAGSVLWFDAVVFEEGTTDGSWFDGATSVTPARKEHPAHVNVGGEWKPAVEGWVNAAGEWKPLWPIIPPGPAITGGTVEQDGEWTVHTFNDSGDLVVTAEVEAEWFLIAGGGAGGSRGGGAGGLIPPKTVTLAPGTYPVVIGDGGPAVAANVEASNGQNSTFNGETAIGGGAGGHQPGPANGKDGGSGGAGVGFNTLGGAGTPGQGNAGGGGFTGHGGGAGGSGAMPEGGPESGGLGIEVWGTFYASGGTAGMSNMAGANPTIAPQPGGGGRGSQGPVAAEAGVDGTGGGGGGGGMNDTWTAFGLCGKGGKGVFKIRYKTA